MADEWIELPTSINHEGKAAYLCLCGGTLPNGLDLADQSGYAVF